VYGELAFLFPLFLSIQMLNKTFYEGFQCNIISTCNRILVMINMEFTAGYSLSKDGLNWTEAHYLPIQMKVKKWWDVMRTPLCLKPEGNDKYTIIYAAIVNNKRFNPMWNPTQNY
jgi:hypothetical protein